MAGTEEARTSGFAAGAGTGGVIPRGPSVEAPRSGGKD